MFQNVFVEQPLRRNNSLRDHYSLLISHFFPVLIKYSRDEGALSHSRSPPLDPRLPSSSAAPPVLTRFSKSIPPALATAKSGWAIIASCTAFMLSFKAVEISRKMLLKLSLMACSLRKMSSERIGISSTRWLFLKLPPAIEALLKRDCC